MEAILEHQPTIIGSRYCARHVPLFPPFAPTSAAPLPRLKWNHNYGPANG